MLTLPHLPHRRSANPINSMERVIPRASAGFQLIDEMVGSIKPRDGSSDDNRDWGSPLPRT